MGDVKLERALIASGFKAMDERARGAVLSHIVAADREMREHGQAKPVWDGAVPESDVIGREVVARTGVGEIVGQAVYFSVARDLDGVYKRTVVVHVPCSGTLYQVPGRDVRPAGADDVRRMHDEVGMAGRLRAAEDAIIATGAERRSRAVPGSGLVDEMLASAKAAGMCVDDRAGFHKVFGNAKGRCIYLAKRGGRADLSGFCVDHPAVTPVTEEQARARHIGKVRGQIDFSRGDEAALEAWALALGAVR